MTTENEIIQAANNLRGMDAVIPPPQLTVPPITVNIPKSEHSFKFDYPTYDWLFTDIVLFTCIGTYLILLGFIIRGLNI